LKWLLKCDLEVLASGQNVGTNFLTTATWFWLQGKTDNTFVFSGTAQQAKSETELLKLLKALLFTSRIGCWCQTYLTFDTLATVLAMPHGEAVP